MGIHDPDIGRRAFLRALGAAGALAMGASGCIGASPGPATQPAGNLTYEAIGMTRGKFAEFVPPAASAAPSLGDYAVDASGLAGLESLGVGDAGRIALAKSLFYLEPSTDAQIYDVYKDLSEAGLPAFVTTDAVLHAYHVLFDYVLRMLEVRHFGPDIIALSKLMLDESKARMGATGKAGDAALKNAAFFAVALDLLGESPSLPSGVDGLVRGELALIKGHEGFAASPIFGYQEDYSQYVPRGHYDRNETLKKYFMAMMWYGRMAFLLKTGDDPEAAKEQTRRAILITLALGNDAFGLWEGVYEPTAFFVGETDDLSAYDYGPLIREVYGSSVGVEDLADDVKLQAFMDRALLLKEPKIVSTCLEDTDYAESGMDAIKGFRFMGQRFIPDSYVFQELVYAKVGTRDEPRLFPKGLDVMAVLGSGRAYGILDAVYGETRYANYAKRVASLKGQFAALDADAWTQNLYWCWLYCLTALLDEKGDGYPAFMKGRAWADKGLNTALGSWAELRHDTLLYAKQSYTMLASAHMPPPSPPKGYVEPNPVLYGRLASLAAMAIDGLEARGLLLDAFGDRLTRLRDLLATLKAIAEKELTDATLAQDDYDAIRHVGSTLEGITTFPPEVKDAIASDTDERMAVVADVHTDVNTGLVLEEGVGNPCHIYVAVPVEGKAIVAKGAAFSYYEFTWPMGDRLTDAKWQALLDGNSPPEAPEWARDLWLPAPR